MQSISVLEESDRHLAEVEGSVEGGMTTVNDSHPVEEGGMIIYNGHPDEYETQHTSFEDSLTPYANKTLKPDGGHA